MPIIPTSGSVTAGDAAARVRSRAAELVTDVAAALTKATVLQGVVNSVSDADIVVEQVSVRESRMLASEPKTKSPGDSDTSDPWTVPDGTADWDVNDPIH